MEQIGVVEGRLRWIDGPCRLSESEVNRKLPRPKRALAFTRPPSNRRLLQGSVDLIEADFAHMLGIVTASQSAAGSIRLSQAHQNLESMIETPEAVCLDELPYDMPAAVNTQNGGDIIPLLASNSPFVSLHDRNPGAVLCRCCIATVCIILHIH